MGQGPAVVDQVFLDVAAARLRLAFERVVFNVILSVLRPDEIEADPLRRRPDFARQPFLVADKHSSHERLYRRLARVPAGGRSVAHQASHAIGDGLVALARG